MPLTSIQVRGPFKGPSGYDHHVREFVRELHNQGLEVQLVDLPEWGPAGLPEHLRDPWFDSLERPVAADVVLQFCMPHQVRPVGGKLNVNYTMFEATRIPAAWAAASRNHDLVVLPTESSKRAWLNGGMPEDKLKLCPLGIDARLFRPEVVPMQLSKQDGRFVSDYRVRFLNVSELGARKNLVGLLRVWLKSTSSADDAVLVVKLGCYAPGWLELFQHQTRLLQEEIGKSLAEAAPVHFVYDLFSDHDMPRLYAVATHYISLSFGEGWDQAMVEAAASGLRLIAPDHSAYSAYLDASIAQLIPSREVPAAFPASDPTGALFAGACWWEPDEDSAIGCIRSAIDGRDQPSASARERVLREFRWQASTRRLVEILEEARARKVRPRFWPLPQLYRRE
jgi:glycosyltransferase involved in cell wall biosynthesis